MQSDDTARIPLRARDGSVQGYTLIDAADADFVNQWRWHLDLKSGYAIRGQRIGEQGGRFRTFSLHRVLLGLTWGDGIEVDHIDLDKLNNRRSNLRIATRDEQMQNLPHRTDGVSKYRGVSFDKRRGKWKAEVQVGKKRQWLGYFITEEAAAEAARETRALLMPYATN